jgi:glycine/D-amino acid oxidase-like deaminating enzyme
LALAESGLRVVVVDAAASLGQGAHKAAIGGVRATHGDPAKMRVGRESLAVFRGWQEAYGDDIEWVTSGYAFVAYREREATMLQRLVVTQRSAGLDVAWLDADGAHARVPALARDGLLGGRVVAGRRSLLDAAGGPGDGGRGAAGRRLVPFRRAGVRAARRGRRGRRRPHRSRRVRESGGDQRGGRGGRRAGESGR